MNEVDWSKAPDGAEWHALSESGPIEYWYGVINSELRMWFPDGWKKSRFNSIGDVAEEFFVTARPDFQPFTSIKDAQPAADMVNHPPHYQSDNGIECIDAIRAALGHDGFASYCTGNAIKYLWRDKTDRVEDLRKAAWYLNRAIEEQSK